MAKLSFEYVKEQFDKRGYELVSKEYSHKSIPLNVVCDKGHTTTISWNSFRNGRGCRVCANNQLLDIKLIGDRFKARGYILLSDSYVGNSSLLEFRCNKGHYGQISWMSFSQGSGCSKCTGNRKLNQEFIDKEFLSRGFIVKGTYVNSKARMLVECSKGHSFYRSWNELYNCRGCPVCSCRKKYTPGDITAVFYAFGYEVLKISGEGNRSMVYYKCSNGHEHKISFDAFHNQGQRCPLCQAGSSVSRVSSSWLDVMKIKAEFREYKIKELGCRGGLVDGFDETTNTVYEFLGDYWHGNPSRKDCVGVNKVNGAPFKELYIRTFQRFDKLVELGYKVVYIWEKDFLERKQAITYEGNQNKSSTLGG